MTPEQASSNSEKSPNHSRPLEPAIVEHNRDPRKRPIRIGIRIGSSGDANASNITARGRRFDGIGGAGVRINLVSVGDAARPGLYAFHASVPTWRQLGLGTPPDARPVYVGKAENTLASRDIDGHFGSRARGAQSPTGSSTLRRSLAALLAVENGYVALPRNITNPGYFANYDLCDADDRNLSAWMRRRLRLAVWPHDAVLELDGIETAVLRQLEPPLNIDKVTTPWRGQLKAARAHMAAEARAWSVTSAKS